MSAEDRSTRTAYDEWGKLLGGLVLAFAVLQGVAQALGSDRGQAGLVVAAATIATLLAVEGLLFRQSPASAIRLLGFGPPATVGVATALGISAVLLAVIPAYAALKGASLAQYPRWLALLPGLFAQGGIAEEALFRGYLFRRLRNGRPFWHAAVLATLPFVLVHLTLFATMPGPVALAAVLLSTIMAFPLARLFELGGNTIWAPALLHFTVQGAIKVVEILGDTTLPIVWMAASATLPWLAFLAPWPSNRR